VPIHKRVARAFEDRPTGSISVDTARPVTIVADERNNALLVRSSYRLFQRIRDAVKVLDVPLSQVVIEATILEVKITDALKYGVQWYLAGNGFTLRNSSSSTVSDSGLTGLVATAEQLASGISVTAVIDALDDVTDVSVVSSPYLTVMDRKTARLVVGDQIPFTTTSQTVSNDGESVINQNIEIKDTGVILEVQPVIRADNSIELHIVQELSSAELAASLSTLTPTVTTRQITSDIMVYSGRTVLLGGLIQDRKDEQKTGIPLLRQAPVVGKLFEQTSTTDTRTEVIVLITPRVARKSGEIERITEQLRQHLRLSGTFPDRPADEAAD
jgi:general secretion pathway protein D